MESVQHNEFSRQQWNVVTDVHGGTFSVTITHQDSKREWYNHCDSFPVMTGIDLSACQIFDMIERSDALFPVEEPKELSELIVTIHANLGDLGIKKLLFPLNEHNLSSERRLSLIIADLRNELRALQQQPSQCCSYTMSNPLVMVGSVFAWNTPIYCNTTLFVMSPDYTTITISEPGVYRITSKVLANNGKLITALYISGVVKLYAYVCVATPYSDCYIHSVRPLNQGDTVQIHRHSDPYISNHVNGVTNNELSIERLGRQ